MSDHEVTLFACGPKPLCRDGQPHSMDRYVPITDIAGRTIGETLACSKCGQTAYEEDRWL